MRRAILVLAAALAVGAFAACGLDPFGRAAMTLGAPRLAAALFDDPHWRGIAHYRAGDFERAAGAFAEVGPDGAYNRANAEVRRGRYAAALESYDVAMARRPDPAAQTNFDIVSAVYAGVALDPDSFARWGTEREGETVEAETGRGDGRASGDGDQVTNTGATIGLPKLESRDRLGVRKIFDDQFVVASPRWLATLDDAPGAFLAARIAHERKRRLKAGEAQPEAPTPW